MRLAWTGRVALASLLVIGADRTAWTDDRGEALLAQTIAATSQTQTLAADMTVIRRAAGGGEDRRTGRVFVGKPNKLRVTLSGKGGMNAVNILSDGTTVYFSNSKLYTRDPVKADGSNIGTACDAPLLNFFLRPNITALAPGFKAPGKPVYKGKEQVGGVPCDIIAASGTKPSAYSMTLSVGPDRLPRRAVLRLQVTAKFSEVYEVQFTRVAVNPKFDPSLFRFTAPPGATEFVPPDREPEKKKP